jgi:hypothetical protein
MHRRVEQLGKVGNTVWGKNRHGQTCYALVIPTNPRTEAQQANRHHFGGVGSTWRQRTDSQRALWQADARHYRTHGRPGSRAPLTGFQHYMSVNSKRARQGLPLLEVPPSSFIIHPSSFSEVPPSSFIIRPSSFPSAPPRVPMRHRTKAVVTRFRHAWTPLAPRAAPVHDESGPRQGILSAFSFQRFSFSPQAGSEALVFSARGRGP